MSYGIRIFDEKGQEMVETSQNMFLVDVIYNATSNGNKTYTPSANQQVVAVPVCMDINSSNPTKLIEKVSVSGNTVSWSVFGQTSFLQHAIFIYYKGVA